MKSILNRSHNPIPIIMDSNQTITIQTPQGFIQTKYSTIQNTQLVDLIDSKYQINIDILLPNMITIINYLRGYNVDLKQVSCDAKRLDLLDIHDTVLINIGGKIYCLEKQFLVSNFKFFESFFEWNKDSDPDYSEHMIDRCYMVFDDILNHVMNNTELKNPFSNDELNFYICKRPLISKDGYMIDTNSFPIVTIEPHIYELITFEPSKCNTFDIRKYYGVLIKFIDNIPFSQLQDNMRVLDLKDQSVNIYDLVSGNRIIYCPINHVLMVHFPTILYSKVILPNEFKIDIVKLITDTKLYKLRDEAYAKSCWNQERISHYKFKHQKFSITLGTENDTNTEYTLNLNTIFNSCGRYILKKLMLTIHNNPESLSYIIIKQSDKIICKTGYKMNYLYNHIELLRLYDTNLSISHLITSEMNCDIVLKFKTSTYTNLDIGGFFISNCYIDQ